jgi:uncharacterized protein YhfF
MKLLYEATSPFEAHLILDLLHQQNINAQLRGEYLQSALGELPAAGLLRLWVDSTQYKRALEVIGDWESGAIANQAVIQEVQAQLDEFGLDTEGKNFLLGRYGDSASLSKELISLILAQKKTATSSLFWAYEFDGEVVPQEGDLEIILDWNDEPVAVTELKQVEVLPFERVSWAQALAEGEYNPELKPNVLEQWREAHWRFFTAQAQRVQRTASLGMPVVFVHFELLHLLPR